MLTAEQAQQIYDAIHADETANQFASEGNDDAVCAWCNRPTITVHRRATASHLLLWSADRGIITKLESEILHGTNGKREIAKTAMLMLQSGIQYLTLDDKMIGRIDMLVAGGVLSAEDKADLFERVAETISFSEFVCGRLLTIADIGNILAPDRPNGKIRKLESI